MTDTNERLLTAAKLREQVRDELDGGDRLHPHAGVVDDHQHRTALSFVESAFAGDDLDDLDATSFVDTDLGSVLSSKIETDTATEAVHQGNDSVMSHLVGVTEQDLDGSALRLPMLLNEQLENNDAPAFIVGAGNPNTGKTNTMSLMVELRDYALDDDLLVLSNVRSWERTDIVVTSAHDLVVQLLEHRERTKFVLIDEASTHFDARTYRHEVATQWTPLAKRFAKIGVDAVGTICHTGKDLHPEAKRLATLAYFKLEPDVVEFYERWQADADYPSDQLFGGDIDNLEPTDHQYDPDDSAPWCWDLAESIFAEDLSWDELLEILNSRGPAV